MITVEELLSRVTKVDDSWIDMNQMEVSQWEEFYEETFLAVRKVIHDCHCTTPILVINPMKDRCFPEGFSSPIVIQNEMPEVDAELVS